MKLAGSLLFLTLTLQSNHAAAGSIDPTFPPTNLSYAIVKLALQSDSKILAAGATKLGFGGVSETNLLRLNTNGTIDSSFTRTKLRGGILAAGDLRFTNPPSVLSLAVQSDDKILLGGVFETVNETPRTNLVRLNIDGTVDLAFNAAALNNSVTAIVPLFRGELLIAGAFDKIGTTARKNLARLNANGSVNTTFAPGWTGTIYGGQIQTLRVQDDGKILAAGAIGTLTGFTPGALPLVRFNADGTLDTTFTPPKFQFLTENVHSIALQSDGSIVIAGAFATLDGVPKRGIAKLSSTGTLDSTWGGPGVQGNASVSAMVPQPDGKFVVAGSFSQFSDIARKGFIRLNVDGTIDQSLNYTDGSSISVGPIALQQDGTIVAGGIFTLGVQTFTLVRILGKETGATAPAITTQPVGQTVTTGSAVNLTVVAAGGASLTYQWYREGVALPGETHAGLSLSGITAAQAGSYHVIVSNATGSTQSATAVIVVNSPPVITTQPVTQSVARGSNLNLSVVASGTAPLTYQWQFHGLVLTNETNSTLTLNNILPIQAGKYRVIVHNSLGDATSAEATVTVTVPPPLITTHPQSQNASVSTIGPLPSCTTLNSVNLQGAVLTMTVIDGAAPFANSGSYTITLDPTGSAYHVSANGINPARNGTWSFGPDLGIQTVLTVNNYLDAPRQAGPPTHWALLANCEYELYADGMVSSQHGTYTITGGTTGAVQTVTFTVQASNALTYQWFHNGVALPEATNSILNVIPIASAAGTYTVNVSNDGGTTTSNPAVLTIGSTPGARIEFSLFGLELSMNWPSGYVLQSTPSLLPATWQTVGIVPPLNALLLNRQEFFRLARSSSR